MYMMMMKMKMKMRDWFCKEWDDKSYSFVQCFLGCILADIYIMYCGDLKLSRPEEY